MSSNTKFTKERKSLIINFLKDIAQNYDCDSDGHKYNTYCRSCEANAILRDMGISTRHQENIDAGFVEDLYPS